MDNQKFEENNPSRVFVFIFWVIVTYVVIAVVVLPKSSIIEIEEEENAIYCEMVSIWNSQSHKIPANRDGWPPYKGEEQCQKQLAK